MSAGSTAASGSAGVRDECREVVEVAGVGLRVLSAAPCSALSIFMKRPTAPGPPYRSCCCPAATVAAGLAGAHLVPPFLLMGACRIVARRPWPARRTGPRWRGGGRRFEPVRFRARREFPSATRWRCRTVANQRAHDEQTHAALPSAARQLSQHACLRQVNRLVGRDAPPPPTAAGGTATPRCSRPPPARRSEARPAGRGAGEVVREARLIGEPGGPALGKVDQGQPVPQVGGNRPSRRARSRPPPASASTTAWPAWRSARATAWRMGRQHVGRTWTTNLARGAVQQAGARGRASRSGACAASTAWSSRPLLQHGRAEPPHRHPAAPGRAPTARRRYPPRRRP